MFAVKVGSMLCSVVCFSVCKALHGTHLLRKLISELGESKINRACITKQNFIPVPSTIVKKLLSQLFQIFFIQQELPLSLRSQHRMWEQGKRTRTSQVYKGMV